MKKIYTILFGVFAVSTTMAQVNKLPLIEHFTQASSGPCATLNPELKSTLDAYGEDNYVRISHQVFWPGYDPMNEQFPAGPKARVNYYGISGITETTLNGGASGSPNNVVTSSTLAAEAAKMTPYAITANQAWNGGDIDLTISIENTTSTEVSSADILYVTLLEDHISYVSAPGSNGETDFLFVMREMYNASTGAAGATNGAALAPIVGEGSVTYNITITPPNYVRNLNELSFAVYVQNNSSKEIMQAAKSTPVENPNLLNASSANTTTAGDGYCNYACTPSFTVTNNGSSTFTSINASYSIDGGAAVSKTFSANIAPGASESFSFDATTLTPGTSTVTTNVISINDTTWFVSPSAMAGAPITFSKLKDESVSGDVDESFESVPLIDGTGYSRTVETGIFAGSPVVESSFSIIDGPTFGYGAIGGFANSNRSIRFRYFSLSNNESLEFVLEKINLANNPQLSFSHAYRQYENENDRLEIFVSTDCGDTWTSVFNKAGTSLTNMVASTTQYIPTSAADWNANTVDLAAYANTNDVVIKFVGTSAYGNNLYVDDIEVTSTVGINEIINPLTNVRLYPNPSVGETYLHVGEAAIETLNIRVYNAVGALVLNETIANAQGNIALNTVNLPVGVYAVNCNTGSDTKNFQLIVQ